ncbi:hypothetical protein B0H63DRAFT_185188 [Podospora didyma]|uniref:Uncharacterized protein n=1 Tax=Podospora didyma TaxID=330526 RepID=A0AAE0NQB3_9PEZI|nr:hypothetical protein B0H63DRAFT_185188 [Podospora didyma]
MIPPPTPTIRFGTPKAPSAYSCDAGDGQPAGRNNHRGHLLPLKQSIQRQLQKLIEANDAANWFTIYLCIFVLLNNYEIATVHDHGWAIRYSMKTPFANYPLLKGFHAGAKTLLAHFHYCCKGDELFRVGWSSPRGSSLPL